jgi:hypothetical protein
VDELVRDNVSADLQGSRALIEQGVNVDARSVSELGDAGQSVILAEPDIHRWVTRRKDDADNLGAEDVYVERDHG